MINEKRVKECFRLAVFDKHDEARCRQMGQYYKSDYVGKELVKSVFTGTFAFIFIGALGIMDSLEELLNSLNNLDWIQAMVRIGIGYACFMAVYLLITSTVYNVRYSLGRRNLKKYYGRLKKLNRAYERESKQNA